MNHPRRHVLGGIAAVLVAACTDSTDVSAPKMKSLPPSEASWTMFTGYRNQIQNTSTGTITIPAGEFTLDTTILITNKSALTIQGAGIGLTKIHLPSSFVGRGAFRVHSNINGLTIRDLSIEGLSVPFDRDIHGIYTDSGPSGITNVKIERVQLEDIGVGISFQVASSCSVIHILDNRVYRMRSRIQLTPHEITGELIESTSGSGYGIHTKDCADVLIKENVVEDAERHGIYMAGGDGGVTIEHNLILNHLQRVVQNSLNYGDPRYVQRSSLTAMAVARGSNVRLGFNVVANPYAHAISIDPNEATPNTPLTGIQLIGNKVIGTREKDIRVTALGTYDVWGNLYYHRGTIGGDTIAAYSDSLGTAQKPPTRWNGTVAFDAEIPGEVVYVVQNNHMHQVTKNYGVAPIGWNWTSYEGGFSAVQAIAGTSSNGVFYMMNNTLVRSVPAPIVGDPWIKSVSPTNWAGFEAMAYSTGRLYVIQSGYLHKIDPATWSYRADGTEPTPNWYGTQALVAFHGIPYIMRNDCLYEVSPSTLSAVRSWC
jgi:hypothetical protein